MKPCDCEGRHEPMRVVLTGGPGAGKTAVLELVRQSFCTHVGVLHESAGILFGGGFPRREPAAARQAAQRAIFHVQRELEAVAEAEGQSIVLCDRGTVDGGAYWPPPGDLWSAVGSTRERELARYDAVIHLRTPPPENGYNHQNPLRVETAVEAAAIDERIAHAWAGHPRRYFVPASASFLTKARQALGILRELLPESCARQLVPVLEPDPDPASLLLGSDLPPGDASQP